MDGNNFPHSCSGRVFLRYLWIFEGPQMVEGGLGERPLGMGEGELGEMCGRDGVRVGSGWGQFSVQLFRAGFSLLPLDF